MYLQLETDNAPKYDTIPTLIDSECMGTAMDSQQAKAFGVQQYKYLAPILVFNVDRSPNKLEHITHYAKILVQIGEYVGTISTAISDLGSRPPILGYDWLKWYNPDINWQEHIIMFKNNGENFCQKAIIFFPPILYSQITQIRLYTV